MRFDDQGNYVPGSGDWAEEAPPIHEPVDWDAIWELDATPKWIVPRFIHTAMSTALYSPAGLGKSLFALEMCIAAANGGPFLGDVLKAHRVLYLDWENDPLYQIRARADSMGYGPKHLKAMTYLSMPDFGPLNTPGGKASLMRHVEHYAPDLVVVDTLIRSVEGDENDAATIADYARLTGTALKGGGVAVLRLDHTGWNTTHARGSSAKRGDIDIEWSMNPDEDTLKLECHKQRIPVGYSKLHLKAPDPSERPWRQEIVDAPALQAVIEDIQARIMAIQGWEDMGINRIEQAYRDGGGKVKNDRLRSVLARMRTT